MAALPTSCGALAADCGCGACDCAESSAPVRMPPQPMRHVAHSLLVGVEAKASGPQPLSVSAAQQQEGPWYDGGAVQLAAGVHGCVVPVVYVASSGVVNCDIDEAMPLLAGSLCQPGGGLDLWTSEQRVVLPMKLPATLIKQATCGTVWVCHGTCRCPRRAACARTATGSSMSCREAPEAAPNR